MQNFVQIDKNVASRFLGPGEMTKNSKIESHVFLNYLMNFINDKGSFKYRSQREISKLLKVNRNLLAETLLSLWKRGLLLRESLDAPQYYLNPMYFRDRHYDSEDYQKIRLKEKRSLNTYHEYMGLRSIRSEQKNT